MVDVAIQTSSGTIVVALDTAKAPATTRNFLRYVDTHAYDGAAFYRTVRSREGEPRSIEVIQGGLQGKRDAAKQPPIAVEKTETTGLHNTNATIAMARTADPNSTTSEFFINIGDDTVLDSEKFNDRYGYAVFGRVVKGYDVVLRIQRAAASGEALTPPIRINRVLRVR